MPNLPITVNGSRLPATLAAALRQLILLTGTFAVGKGWVKAEDIQGIATIALTVATLAYGLWKTSHKQALLIAAARNAPDSVAQVK